MASELLRSEVQVLRLASTAASSSSDLIVGNFRLSWGDGEEETDYLPADVGEVELEAALEALVDVRDIQVRITAFRILRGRKSESIAPCTRHFPKATSDPRDERLRRISSVKR